MLKSSHIPVLTILITAAVTAAGLCAGCDFHKAKIEHQKELVRRLIDEALNKGNFTVMDELCSAEYTGHLIPYGDKDREAYKTFFTGFRDVYPDVVFNIKSIAAEDDNVTVLATYQGTGKKTGKQVSGPGLIMFRFKDGKIVESWDIWDELGYWRQLGYKMTPPVTDSTFARVTIIQSKPEQVAEADNIYRDSVAPDLKKQKGFHGCLLLRDVATGKGMSIVLWDSEADVIAAEQSGFYQSQIDKFRDLFTAKPIREGYKVMVQE